MSAMMKKLIFILLLTSSASALYAQKIDSIFFHLYTDSLKKGQHNYINVDAKLSDGKWIPLTKELQFSSTEGNFEGNELVIPENFKPEKVTIKAILKSNPSIWVERTIWIKKIPDPEFLPTKEDILNGTQPKKNKVKQKN